jgi:hypothetical protein
VNKSTAFCSAAHRKNSELRTKAFFLFSCQAATKGIYQQKQHKLIVFCSAAQTKFWNLPTKATQIKFILQCRAAKIFGICQHKQLKLAVFCSNVPPQILEWRTSTVFGPAAQRNFLE